MNKKTLGCIVWELTLKCNAHCIHCGSDAGNKKIEELTTFEALSVCKQIAETECRHVNLLGGEIFLKDDWRQIIKALRDRDITVSLITNGSLLNQQNLNFLKEAGINTLGISIDGTRNVHDLIRGLPGLFDSIQQNIQQAELAGFTLSAITTVNKLNIADLINLKNYLITSPFKIWQVQIASANGRMPQEVVLTPEEFYLNGLFLAQTRINTSKEKLAVIANHDFGYHSNIIPRHTIYNQWAGCPAGINTLGIQCDGTIKGCLSIKEELQEPFNIRTTSLKDIWQHKDLCNWNQPERKQKSLTGFCKECNYNSTCLAGCSDMASQQNCHTFDNHYCYHRIETLWQNKTPKNNYESLFQQIIFASITQDGNIYLPDNKLFDQYYLDGLKLNQQDYDLFSLLIQ
jgi:radical SAM protein with 4Fe4S-binding SPASM domain